MSASETGIDDITIDSGAIWLSYEMELLLVLTLRKNLVYLNQQYN